MSATLHETRIAGYGHARDYQSDLALVSPTRQAALAEAYFAMPDREEASLALTAWHHMAAETLQQYEALERIGFTFSVEEENPYETASKLFASIEEDRHVAVLATATTGSHPFFTDEVNDCFRAVHDVMGHYCAQRGFDRHGEEAAYRRHRRAYSPLATLAMTTETRGQNAGLIATGDFVDEKIAVLPDWARHPHALEPVSRAERHAARQQCSRQFGYSILDPHTPNYA